MVTNLEDAVVIVEHAISHLVESPDSHKAINDACDILYTAHKTIISNIGVCFHCGDVYDRSKGSCPCDRRAPMLRVLQAIRKRVLEFLQEELKGEHRG